MVARWRHDSSAVSRSMPPCDGESDTGGSRDTRTRFTLQVFHFGQTKSGSDDVDEFMRRTLRRTKLATKKREVEDAPVHSDGR